MNNWGLELPRKHALMDSHPGNERNDLEMLSTTPFGMRLSPTSQVQDVTYVSGLDIGGMAVWAVRCEPVSLLLGQYQRDFRRKQRASDKKRQKHLQHGRFLNIGQIR
jgi:hypothetical protein